ncbi:hypothetical protein OG533_11640 [Streptomyces sp. NBC_01186]|uniref:hypothetical protein n=1 Tax=Streptomyces sp. NBC_01186 TaxID=2903765 RepID=UPI002E10CC05|nr:hypothetical protein OG533_11640 [Streptomyces sp. NBC_01186]
MALVSLAPMPADADAGFVSLTSRRKQLRHALRRNTRNAISDAYHADKKCEKNCPARTALISSNSDGNYCPDTTGASMRVAVSGQLPLASDELSPTSSVPESHPKVAFPVLEAHHKMRAGEYIKESREIGPPKRGLPMPRPAAALFTGTVFPQ